MVHLKFFAPLPQIWSLTSLPQSLEMDVEHYRGMDVSGLLKALTQHFPALTDSFLKKELSRDVILIVDGESMAGDYGAAPVRDECHVAFLLIYQGG